MVLGKQKGWRGESEEYGRTWGLDRGKERKGLKDDFINKLKILERKKRVSEAFYHDDTLSLFGLWSVDNLCVVCSLCLCLCFPSLSLSLSNCAERGRESVIIHFEPIAKQQTDVIIIYNFGRVYYFRVYYFLLMPHPESYRDG